MGDKTAWLDVIETERALHPGMGVQDLQKLSYQSVFGGDHLLDDPIRFATGVRQEWDRLEDDGTPVSGGALQSIDPDGRTARIHLAVCRALGVDVEGLIEFLVGQDRKGGRRSEYVRRWRETIDLAAAGAIPFDPSKLERVGVPAAPPHHGAGYGAASYRIVHDIADARTAGALRRLGAR